MRAALLLVPASLVSAALVGACIAAPQLEPFDGSTRESTSPTSPRPSVGSGDASVDASAAPTAAPGDDAASAPLPDDAGPPLPATCPPAGAPAGTACCGANGASPPCFGMACEHCGDCIAQGCAAGTICCAVSPGASGKYKSMSCRVADLAGTCPS